MHKKIHSIFYFFVCLAAPGIDGPDSRIEAHQQKIANLIINAINGDRTNIVPFAEQLGNKINTYGYDRFFKYYNDKFGKVTHCNSPTLMLDFTRFQITAEKGRWSMVVTFEGNDLVDGLSFKEPDPVLQVPVRNSMPIRLPFRGEWYVSNGGPTIDTNHHLKMDKTLCGAVDFVALDKDGAPTKMSSMDRRMSNIMYSERIFSQWLTEKSLQ
jgi:hypothetical protein